VLSFTPIGSAVRSRHRPPIPRFLGHRLALTTGAVAWAMLNFFAGTAGLMADPVILIGGVVVGYLFFAEMAKLAWGLLLFVLPSLPTFTAPKNLGFLLDSVAQMAAASIIAALTYWALQKYRMRPRRQV
jgi:hypothetical protein